MRSAILLFLLCAAGAAQTPPARQFLLRLEPVRKDFTLQTMTEAERPVVGEHVAYLTGLLAKGINGTGYTIGLLDFYCFFCSARFSAS